MDVSHFLARGSSHYLCFGLRTFFFFYDAKQYPFLLGKSLILTGLLCLVETWMIAVSCARTIRVYKRLLLLGFVLMFFSYALLVLNQLMMKQPSLMNFTDC
ncbi:hypothetical protein ACEQPO_00795 [Bacillus sp. SL00103]